MLSTVVPCEMLQAVSLEHFRQSSSSSRRIIDVQIHLAKFQQLERTVVSVLVVMESTKATTSTGSEFRKLHPRHNLCTVHNCANTLWERNLNKSSL